MKELFGYKIVDKNLTSMTRGLHSGGVKYKMNEWVNCKRKCGPLAVFSMRIGALAFASLHFFSYSIYKVRYVESRRKFLWDYFTETHNIPIGTVFASMVMLLKRCHAKENASNWIKEVF